MIDFSTYFFYNNIRYKNSKKESKIMKKAIAILIIAISLCGIFAGIAGAVMLQTTIPAERGPKTEINLPLSYISKYMPDFGEVTYPTPEAEAVVAVAKAWLARGEYTQYNDPPYVRNVEHLFKRYTESPEDATSQHTYYTSCSPFTDDVFYQALGIKIGKTAAQEARTTSMQIFSVKPDDVKTDAQREQIQKKFFETLKPGDLVAYARTELSGHILLYIGNGYCIHATGSSYNREENRDSEERYGAVRWTTVDEFFTEGEHNYLWDSQVFSILSPYKAYKCEITQQAQERLKNMQDIYAEKVCTYAEGQTVDLGKEITYTFFLHNYRNVPATLEISDTVPAGTTYVSGAQNVKGEALNWEVTVPAGESIPVSYTVRVKNDASLYGSAIHSQSTVGGVNVNARKIYVGRALSNDAQAKLLAALKDAEGTEITGTTLVNQIYEKAGITLNLPDENTLINRLFSPTSTNYYLLEVIDEYKEMYAPGLYGGLNTKTNTSIGYERTNNMYAYHFLAGDILLAQEEGITYVYLYAGDGLLFDMCPRVSEMLSPYCSELALRSTFGCDKFIVLRPSLKS